MPHDFELFPELTTGQMSFYYFESPHQQISDDFFAKVVRVVDGDTVILETSFRDFEFPLRILDIAAPELGESGGEESKSFLEGLVLNEEIRVEIDKKNRVGRFGRLLGRIRSFGIDVGQFSLNNGQAVPFN